VDLLHRTGIVTIDCLQRQGWELDSQRPGFSPGANVFHPAPFRGVYHAILPFRALLGHSSILVTTRYIHPAPAQRRVMTETFEKVRGEAMISAAAAR
jgi:hypothetical protein